LRLTLLGSLALGGCAGTPRYGDEPIVQVTLPPPPAIQDRAEGEPIHVGVLVLEGAYGSEVTAPHEVLQHAAFVSDVGTYVFTVGRSMDLVGTLEEIAIAPDYDLDSAPRIDVLVVPGGAQNADAALADRRLVRWIAERGERAEFVIGLSDGAFLLAEAGLLDGHECTTHPESLATLQLRYPGIAVVDGVSFVVDSNVVSSVGGAASYEPALFAAEQLFGTQAAEAIGRGLVLDWQLDAVAHRIVDEANRAEAGARPACFLPGETVPADVSFEDANADLVTLGDLAASFEDARAIVLVLFGGAEAANRAHRGGLWCEDSFDDLPLMRYLLLEYEPRGVRFVAVACPPVYGESAFGYDEGAFLTRPADDPVYRENRRKFVEGTLRLRDADVLPFDRLFFDPRFRLLANPEKGVPSEAAGAAPEWQGRFKWHEDSQTYGTPTIWILEPDLTVAGNPFFMNVWESEGRAIRYTPRDVAARLDRLLLE